MFRRIRLAAVVFAGAFIFAPADARERIELAGKVDAAAVPFQLIDNRIFVETRINGGGPYQFIFDTGGQNILDPVAAHELGLALRDESSEIGGVVVGWRARR